MTYYNILHTSGGGTSALPPFTHVTVVGPRHLRSSDVYTCVCRATDTVTDQWQKLHGSWTAAVE